MKIWTCLAFIMTGCATVYVPNARNSPMFGKAGELQGSIGVGNGLDVHGAVAITNHVGLLANYNYENRRSGDQSLTPTFDEFQYHQFIEGGLGYYQNQGDWCYELFAGYGRGEGASFETFAWWGPPDGKVRGEYDRVFIQPAFGMNKKQLFHFSIVPRISLVNFKELASDSTTSYTSRNNPTVFFEPAFMGRINLMNNHLFLAFQLGISVPVEKDLLYDYRPTQFSTGIGFRLGGIHGNSNNK